MLNLQGYPNVANLDGGFILWKAKELPMDSNLSFGGCGCNSGKQTQINFVKKNMKSGEQIDLKNLRRI
ncbi:MAG: hypothetical protein Q8T04_14095, partial [Bacteroidota bacterium]|nr:hypothetical protein [Bacteroidota bacterium]